MNKKIIAQNPETIKWLDDMQDAIDVLAALNDELRTWALGMSTGR